MTTPARTDHRPPIGTAGRSIPAQARRQAVLIAAVLAMILALVAAPAAATRGGPGGGGSVAPVAGGSTPGEPAPGGVVANPEPGPPPAEPGQMRPVRAQPEPGSDDGVELDVHEPVQLVAVPQPTPIPPVGADTGGGGGQLTGNAFGCMSECITNSVLTQDAITGDVEVTIGTSVTTSKIMWVLPAGPYMVDGLPVHVGAVPIATAGLGRTWIHEVGGLDPDTDYRIVVAVVDDQDNVAVATTIFSTLPAAADDFVAAGSPCSFGCIVSGVVSPGDSYDEVMISVVANADVDIELAVSTSAPWTLLDGSPYLENDEQIDVVSITPASVNAKVSGLEGATTYYVVASVTDEEGARQKASGQFTTLAEPPPPPPVETTTVYVHFERVHVHETGDLLGNGEIIFRFGFDGFYGSTDEHSLDEGDGLPLEDGGYVEVGPDGWFPTIMINAIESDVFPSQLLCPIGGPFPLHEFPTTLDCGGNATVATGVLPGTNTYLDWIDTLDPCTDYDVTGLEAAGRCVVVNSALPSDYDWVQYDTLVSFLVMD